MADAFPLQWPEGWARTAQMSRCAAKYKVSSSRAVSEAMHSLVLMGADRRTIVLSSNLQLRLDGIPYANSTNPSDPGVAIYWHDRKLGERVIACDKWTNVYANVRACGLAVEGLRAMQRAGATQILERAFQSFGALPAASVVPVARPWWEVFELPREALTFVTLPMVEAKYRELAGKYHPDKLGTGSVEAFQELGLAREQAREHFGSPTETP